MSLRTFVVAAVAAVALLVPSGPSTAVAPDLVAGAKREGAVVFYTSLDGPTLAAVAARWKAAFPDVAFQPLRMSTSEIPPRLLTEQRGARFGVDVVSGDTSQLRGLAKLDAIVPYRPAEARGVAGMLEEHGWWSVIYNVTTVIAWNTQKLREHGLRPPASLTDLAKPEWKGHIGFDSQALNMFIALAQVDPHAADVLRSIAANAPLMTSGHTQTVTQLAAGEFDVTPTAYGYMSQRAKDEGRPVDYINTRPMIVYPDGAALVKNQPHPNAARLLLDWLVSRDGQQTLLTASGRSSLRRDVVADRRVFDPGRPFVVLRDIEPERYGVLSKEFNAILGVQNGA
jgi:iron(III) transport system substrate-binding protein